MLGDLPVIFGLLALGSPVATAIGLAGTWALGVPLRESHVAGGVTATLAVALVAALGVDVLLLAGLAPREVLLAHWVVVPGYAVDARVVFDAPGAVLMTLTALLTGLISVFSATYLHRDPGLRRFYLLLLLFASGMMAIASAGTLDLLYAGWEVVGLASALLIAYFHTREAPVRNALVAFSVYRLCDVALLTAAVLLHHHAHDAGFDADVHGPVGMGIAALIVVASMGKAAAFPFSGWLARAMEGPTPSSAIFYGALSIHAGPFLLIRAWPLLEHQPEVRAGLAMIGLLTALYASGVGRVQTDVKSAIGFASVAQVGLILVEIAAGFTTLALIHTTGHALLRTWQLLRAPSRLADWFRATAGVGGSLPARGAHWERILPAPVRRFAYAVALERGFLDHGALGLRAALAWPLHRLDGLDRRLARLLAGADVEG